MLDDVGLEPLLEILFLKLGRLIFFKFSAKFFKSFLFFYKTSSLKISSVLNLHPVNSKSFF